jgi:hypothetical protein
MISNKLKEGGDMAEWDPRYQWDTGGINSEFRVRRFGGRVNCGIVFTDFPIGKSPKSGSVDPLTFGVRGFVLPVDCAHRIREIVNTDFLISEREITEGVYYG